MNYRTKKIKGLYVNTVLFDMDGVIVDSMYAHARCWIQVFEEHGVHLDAIDILKREGMSGLESIADIFIDKGFPLPPDTILKNLQKKKLSLFSNYPIEIFPQIYTIFPFLKSKGKNIGIVTGSFRYLVEQLMPQQLLQHVDVIISVDDVKRGKPYPDPYVKALEKLDASNDSTIVIENAPMGIQAAKAAGLYCVAITTTLDSSFLTGADAILHDHNELIVFLMNWCSS